MIINIYWIPGFKNSEFEDVNRVFPDYILLNPKNDIDRLVAARGISEHFKG